nr:hypothetical protein CFP56_22146 [Quercus suber]
MQSVPNCSREYDNPGLVEDLPLSANLLLTTHRLKIDIRMHSYQDWPKLNSSCNHTRQNASVNILNSSASTDVTYMLADPSRTST